MTVARRIRRRSRGCLQLSVQGLVGAGAKKGEQRTSILQRCPHRLERLLLGNRVCAPGQAHEAEANGADFLSTDLNHIYLV
jgi:hypothetical protein